MSLALVVMTSAAALAGDHASKTFARRPGSRCRANRRAPPARLSRRRLLAEWAGLTMLLALTAWVVDASAAMTVPRALCFGGLLGGVSGNALDAWSHGAVTDMVDVGWWPVFNVADASIVTGAAGLLGVVWGAW